jgi:hypothetical protein
MIIEPDRGRRGFEFTWACGPPINMKIGLSVAVCSWGVDGAGRFTLWMK